MADHPYLYVAIAIVAVIIIGIILYIIFKPKQKKQNKKNSPIKETKSGVVEIYVGNLSYTMTDDSLRKEFERFGVVKSARVISHRVNGKSKGYGFVEMTHRKEAGYAIKALNNTELMGRRVRVNEARINTRPNDKRENHHR